MKVELTFDLSDDQREAIRYSFEGLDGFADVDVVEYWIRLQIGRALVELELELERRRTFEETI